MNLPDILAKRSARQKQLEETQKAVNDASVLILRLQGAIAAYDELIKVAEEAAEEKPMNGDSNLS